MSATMISDPMDITTSPESQSTIIVSQTEVEFAICDCCGLTEECTPAYISRIRERYNGKWVCGLCSEAVKDEIVRSKRLVSTEEAMIKHMNFCKKFNTSGPPTNPTVHLIKAMRQILRRSLENPTRVRSTPSSPTKMISREIHGSGALARSESCFSTLSGS
ncbi:uncharacterized protein [Cicer arietinum]|uniref:Uncharacterized protein LOC101498004 n=1 Tax=Cicer arietinum TaxID=3827 RepID=A0A1S2YVB0_CICAR|nr:uncharacterized protein LOC101498004 [Cicer arietinum]